MRDDRHTQSDWGRTGNDPIEQELEAALAKYAAVEPRTGLEERVLANLRTTSIRKRPWWRWSLATALATVLVTAALVWRLGKHSPAIPTDYSSTVIHSPNKPAPEVVTHNARNKAPMGARHEGQRRAGHEVHSQVATAARPKLDQFPSPQPLSEQERILESYVASYPERAVLLARLRTEQLQQDQLEQMKDLSSEGTGQPSKTEE
jgi:hypothetical protein